MSKPLRWNSGDLSINADTTVETGDAGAGAVQISIVHEGHRTPSAPSVPFHGNETDATVEWPSSEAGVASAKGKVIQLRVELTGAARLYSLRGDFAWHEAPLRLKSEDEEQAIYPGTVIYDRPATISPKVNASWSQMPMGNGNISISAWFEAPQDLVFYVGKSDSCKSPRYRWHLLHSSQDLSYIDRG